MPDLLDACERLLEAFNGLRSGLRPSELGLNLWALAKDAEDAIAKARPNG